ncbi:MAG: methionyl-tRNA formyltransferase [Candidatus Omnitrophota bacterium]
MRIIFFGSDIFAVPSLEALVRAGFCVSSVVTQPDKQKGRHLKLGFCAIKAAALKLRIPAQQPEKLSDVNFIERLEGLNPDLLVAVAYGKILSAKILALPRLMAINVHASLLPKYRGAAPINWAIINGEEDTGVTIMKMNEQMDEGEIIAQKATKILAEDSAITLRERLSILGAELLVKVIDEMQSGKELSLMAQKDSAATLAPKLKKSNGIIDWKQGARQITDKIRGLQPWPGAHTQYKDKTLKILKAEISPDLDLKASPGVIVEVSREGIIVETGKGLLKIEEVQLESSKQMSAWAFACGHRVMAGDILK